MRKLKFSLTLTVTFVLALSLAWNSLFCVPILAAAEDEGQAQFQAKGVDVQYLDGKTYQKDGYLEIEQYKSKIALPKVIWSSEENVLEDQAMARERSLKIAASEKVHPELKRIHKIMKPTIYKLSERVYEPYGFEMTNNTIVVGDTGLIIFDTNYSNEIGKIVLEKFREATDNTMDVHTIIYSHHHPDQLSGTAGYVLPEAIERGEVNVIAHSKMYDNFMLESGYAAPGMGHRGLYAFGAALPIGEDGYVSQGVGFVPKEIFSPRTTYTARPNITFDDHLIMKIDGVTMEFFHVPGEAPDHIAIYLPEEETLLVGDCIQGETIPNMYTIRGAKYRDGDQWMKSIDRLRSYHAKAFTNHHGRPVVGAEEVESVFVAWRDAIQYMNDQALRLINNGYTRDEISEMIQLPEFLTDHEYLRPLRGSVSQNVKNIYAGYLGWYNGDPTEQAKPAFKERASLYVKQLGGRNSILKSAETALNKKEYGWAMELATWLIRENPEDKEARNIKAKAMRQWAYLQSTPGWRNWALTGALELEQGPFEMSDKMLSLSDETMDEMNYNDLFKILRVRLNPDGLQDTEELVNLTIGKDEFTFGVRHGVLITDKGFSHKAEGKVQMSRKQFYDAFFFGKGLLKNAHPTLTKVAQAIQSPYGKVVPVVGR